MKRRRVSWLWYWSDDLAPWFGVVKAATKEEAKLIVFRDLGVRVRGQLPASTDEIHVEPVRRGGITVAGGYL